MNMYQRDLVRTAEGAPGAPPRHVLEAAVTWVNSRELDRHYGPAYIIAYSLKAAIKTGVLIVNPELDGPTPTVPTEGGSSHDSIPLLDGRVAVWREYAWDGTPLYSIEGEHLNRAPTETSEQ